MRKLIEELHNLTSHKSNVHSIYVSTEPNGGKLGPYAHTSNMTDSMGNTFKG